MIGFRVPNRIYDALARHALASGLTLSEYLRRRLFAVYNKSTTADPPAQSG